MANHIGRKNREYYRTKEKIMRMKMRGGRWSIVIWGGVSRSKGVEVEKIH